MSSLLLVVCTQSIRVCLHRTSNLYWSLRSWLVTSRVQLELEEVMRRTLLSRTRSTALLRTCLQFIILLLIYAPIVTANESPTSSGTSSPSVNAMSTTSSSPSLPSSGSFFTIALNACNAANSLVLELANANSTMASNLSYILSGDGEYSCTEKAQKKYTKMVAKNK